MASANIDFRIGHPVWLAYLCTIIYLYSAESHDSRHNACSSPLLLLERWPPRPKKLKKTILSIYYHYADYLSTLHYHLRISPIIVYAISSSPSWSPPPPLKGGGLGTLNTYQTPKRIRIIDALRSLSILSIEIGQAPFVHARIRLASMVAPTWWRWLVPRRQPVLSGGPFLRR